MVGGGGRVLECGDIKILRWEPPGRQIRGQVMPTRPKQRKNEMKSVSHPRSLYTQVKTLILFRLFLKM